MTLTSLRTAVRRSLPGFGLLLLSGLLTGCSAPPPPVADAPTGGRVVVIRMTDSLTFSPDQVSIAVGDTIEWVNVGLMPHTVTAKPGSAANPEHVVLPDGADPFESGLLEAGQTFRHVVRAAGTYTYFCALHETYPMVGQLAVK